MRGGCYEIVRGGEGRGKERGRKNGYIFLDYLARMYVLLHWFLLRTPENAVVNSILLRD
jgi:hypothetical protein